MRSLWFFDIRERYCTHVYEKREPCFLMTSEIYSISKIHSTDIDWSHVLSILRTYLLPPYAFFPSSRFCSLIFHFSRVTILLNSLSSFVRSFTLIEFLKVKLTIKELFAIFNRASNFPSTYVLFLNTLYVIKYQFNL